jgi:hypothetical protein
LWVSVPPFRNLLDAANSTFEDLTLGYTIGDWTAESNSTISVVTEKVTWKHFRRGESTVAGVISIQPPKGVAALQVVPVAAGDYTAISDYIPVQPRQNYLARSSHQVVNTNLSVNYDLNATQVAHLEISWYNAAQGFLSTDISDEAPSGAAFARVRVSMNGILYQGELVDDVLFSRVV